jgi:phage terminase large subunit
MALNQKLKIVSINNLDYTPLLSNSIDCPKCKITKITKPETSWWGKCKTCKNSYVCFWKPFPMQQVILALGRLKRTTPIYIFNFGAMNTGKTDVDTFAAVQFALEHPATTQAFLARDFQMIKRVIPESLDPFIHTDFYAKKDGKIRKSIDNGYYFDNGSKFMFLPSDDDKKIRSMNISRWILIEGEDIHTDLVHALSGRLRQDSGVIYETDENGDFILEDVMTGVGRVKKRKKIKQAYYAITVEANPDINSYVYHEGLLESSIVFMTESVVRKKQYDEDKIKTNDFKFSVMSSTLDSPYVKEGYIEEKMQTWTDAEIRANLRGEFVATNMLVYPGAVEHFVEERYVDKKWPHWLSIDPGVGNDPTAVLLKVYDPTDDVMYYYKELYEYKKSLTFIGEEIKKMIAGVNLQDIIMDPSGGKTLQLVRNTSTLQELEGYLHLPIKKAVNALDDGISLIQGRLEENKILFSNRLENLRAEFNKYAYVPDKKKPQDKDNHLMDALRYNEQATRSDVGYDIISTYRNGWLAGTLGEKETRKLPWVLDDSNYKSRKVDEGDFIEEEELSNDWDLD